VLATLVQTLCLLGYLHQNLESRPSLAKQLALLGKRHRLVHGGAKAEKLAQLIESATKTGSRGEASKHTSGSIAV
jgi:hypothetical protein